MSYTKLIIHFVQFHLKLYINTVGFSLASPNYGMGWCGVVSSTGTSATLRTYIYQVWSTAGTYLGYYPTTASNVKFEYTVLGNDPPPAAPQNLSVTESLNEHPLLSWSANTESDLEEYNVYRKGGYPFVDWTIIATPTSNSYEDTDITTTYRGCVKSL